MQIEEDDLFYREVERALKTKSKVSYFTLLNLISALKDKRNKKLRLMVEKYNK